MTTGVIVSYDPEEESGFIVIDDTDDRVPFDADAVADFKEGEMLREGQRVQFKVQGGMAGVWATDVRRIQA